VLVVGLGRSARAVVDHVVREGATAHVVDRADTPALRREAAALEGRATVQLGGYAEPALDECNLLVASPGVPWDAPLLAAARRRQIPVSSELDLFFRACPAPIAGITGTNGKTTTTALAGAILSRGERPVVVGGNIGETVLDRLPAITPAHWVVLELSSFQLESVTAPRLRIGAILNVTEDHLDRHRTMAEYTDVKARAITFMDPGDHAVLNFDDRTVVELSRRTAGQLLPFSIKPGSLGSGVCLEEGAIVVRQGARRDRVMAAREVPLPGAHNLSNALAAIAVGWAAGISPEEMAEAVRRFTGVEHRIELVGTFAGVRYYNDSKATNPDSTLKALAAFEEPIVLIAGGRAKGADLEPLLRAIRQRVQHVVVIGETAAELERRIRERPGPPVERAGDLRAAVRAAAAAASPGSVVLLSPAFASYDMFDNYEDRGRRFKEAVREELVGAH
jgi:UDP-N-acetylmuramoylalanine--D-glutamate ligase